MWGKFFFSLFNLFFLFKVISFYSDINLLFIPILSKQQRVRVEMSSGQSRSGGRGGDGGGRGGRGDRRPIGGGRGGQRRR